MTTLKEFGKLRASDLRELKRATPELPSRCNLVLNERVEGPTRKAKREAYERAWKELAKNVRFANFVSGVYRASDIVRLKLANSKLLDTRRALIDPAAEAMKTALREALRSGWSFAGALTRSGAYPNLTEQAVNVALDAAYVLGWDRDDRPGYYDGDFRPG